jgi:hypothetical protein
MLRVPSENARTLKRGEAVTTCGFQPKAVGFSYFSVTDDASFMDAYSSTVSCRESRRWLIAHSDVRADIRDVTQCKVVE